MPRPQPLALLARCLLIVVSVAAPASADDTPQPTSLYLPQLGGALLVDPDLIAIAEAADGLLYPNESDRPFTPFIWERASPQTPVDVCRELSKQLPSFEMRALAAAFAPLVAVYPGATRADLARAARFAALRDLIAERLDSPIVCRAGTIAVDVYILGVSRSGQVVGLHTVSIET